jgi:hypothetical protein
MNEELRNKTHSIESQKQKVGGSLRYKLNSRDLSKDTSSLSVPSQIFQFHAGVVIIALTTLM